MIKINIFKYLKYFSYKWQCLFQDPATSIMENFIAFHHDIIISTVITVGACIFISVALLYSRSVLSGHPFFLDSFYLFGVCSSITKKKFDSIHIPILGIKFLVFWKDFYLKNTWFLKTIFICSLYYLHFYILYSVSMLNNVYFIFEINKKNYLIQLLHLENLVTFNSFLFFLLLLFPTHYFIVSKVFAIFQKPNIFFIKKIILLASSCFIFIKSNTYFMYSLYYMYLCGSKESLISLLNFPFILKKTNLFSIHVYLTLEEKQNVIKKLIDKMPIFDEIRLNSDLLEKFWKKINKKLESIDFDFFSMETETDLKNWLLKDLNELLNFFNEKKTSSIGSSFISNIYTNISNFPYDHPKLTLGIGIIIFICITAFIFSSPSNGNNAAEILADISVPATIVTTVPSIVSNISVPATGVSIAKAIVNKYNRDFIGATGTDFLGFDEKYIQDLVDFYDYNYD